MYDIVWIDLQNSAEPEANFHAAGGKAPLFIFKALVLPDVDPELPGDVLLGVAKAQPGRPQNLSLGRFCFHEMPSFSISYLSL